MTNCLFSVQLQCINCTMNYCMSILKFFSINFKRALKILIDNEYQKKGLLKTIIK
jgi:hypothetical protein